MYHAKAVFGGVLVLLLALSHATAGVVLTVHTESLAGSGQSGIAMLYIEKSRLRIDSTEGGQNFTTIYRLDAPGGAVYWLIDNSVGTYVEITQEEMDQAIAILEELMTLPYQGALGRIQLELDPIWAPLESSEGFRLLQGAKG